MSKQVVIEITPDDVLEMFNPDNLEKSVWAIVEVQDDGAWIDDSNYTSREDATANLDENVEPV